MWSIERMNGSYLLFFFSAGRGGARVSLPSQHAWHCGNCLPLRV